MQFIVTGTSAYGPMSEESDLDIVMYFEDVEEIRQFLDDHKINRYKEGHQEDYGEFGGFYFDIGSLKINVIIVQNKHEFKEWSRKTKQMKEHSPIADKQKRHDTFNEFMGFEPGTSNRMEHKSIGKG